MSYAMSCDCTFCEEFRSPPAAPNRILWDGGGLVILPTIGCLTPGYCLLMPKRHVRSFADLSFSECRAAADVAEEARTIIAARFGPTIIAEHGPGSPGTFSSACCDHAHWHLVPVDPYLVSRRYKLVGGTPQCLVYPDELRRWAGQAYIYLSPMQDVRWIWPHSEVFSSQFARRVCAEILGCGELYDWSAFSFNENMLLTREELGPHFTEIGASTVGTADDTFGSARICA